jgi:hypothetical protein
MFDAHQGLVVEVNVRQSPRFTSGKNGNIRTLVFLPEL